MDFLNMLTNPQLCFVYLAEKPHPFSSLAVIYVFWCSRTSYLRSLIHPNCGCFMVAPLGIF